MVKARFIQPNSIRPHGVLMVAHLLIADTAAFSIRFWTFVRLSCNLLRPPVMCLWEMGYLSEPERATQNKTSPKVHDIRIVFEPAQASGKPSSSVFNTKNIPHGAIVDDLVDGNSHRAYRLGSQSGYQKHCPSN